MSFRFYLSPIIGTGAEGDSWRPKALDVAASIADIREIRCWMPAATDLSPLNTHCVVLIDADDHTPFEKDPEITPLDKVSEAIDIGAKLETATSIEHIKDPGKIPPDLDQKRIAVDSITRFAAEVGIVDAIVAVDP
jgi:hypothetical protein